MTKRLPFMRWCPEDYRRDTAHLSLAEDCVYRRLLERMWECGGTLPDNDRQIARLAGITYKRWLGFKEVVLAFFHSIDGRLHQRRIDRDLKKATKPESSAKKATDSVAKKAHDPQRKSLKTQEADSRIVPFPAPEMRAKVPPPPKKVSPKPLSKNHPLPPASPSVPSGEAARAEARSTQFDQKDVQREPKERTPKQPPPDFDLSSQDPDEKIGTGKGAKQDEKGFRRALAFLCLDPEVVDNIVTSRRLKRAVLTPLAGRNLAAALASCGDATDAAILMIDKGWLGIKADWYQREQARYAPQPMNGRGFAPPDDENARSLAALERYAQEASGG